MPRSAAGVVCPQCGARFVAMPDGAAGGANADARLDALVQLTRTLLDADVALLTEIREGRETACRSAGEWPQVNSFKGLSLPLSETFCQRMLDGRIGHFIADAQVDDRVSDLAMARQLGVRAWIGVPVKVSDAQLYVLCCLARESRPNLGVRDVRLLLGLAESVRNELQTPQPD